MLGLENQCIVVKKAASSNIIARSGVTATTLMSNDESKTGSKSYKANMVISHGINSSDSRKSDILIKEENCDLIAVKKEQNNAEFFPPHNRADSAAYNFLLRSGSRDSGIETTLTSASNSSSSNLPRPPTTSSNMSSSASESETSDYQRSTPSPRDDILKTPASKSVSASPFKDLGLGDEIKEEVEAEVEPPQIVIQPQPKIVLKDARVTLEKLTSAQLPPGCRSAQISSSIRSDQLSSGCKSPQLPPSCRSDQLPSRKRRRSSASERRRTEKEERLRKWLQTASPEKCLIRPAKLVTNFQSRDQEDEKTKTKTGGGHPFKLENSAKYLFGEDETFEKADEDDLDEEDEDEETPEDNVSESPKQPLSIQTEIESNNTSNVIKSPRRLLDKALLVVSSSTSLDIKQEEPETNGSSSKPQQVSPPPKIRFPAAQGSHSRNMIECKWEGCVQSFTTYGKLSDHLKADHVIAQVKEKEKSSHNRSSGAKKVFVKGSYFKPPLSPPNKETYFFQCLWAGCKVFGEKSTSKSWLERHVPTHGGKFAFVCIVGGCKMRFSTQKNLQRHVNQHFADNTSTKKDASSSAQAIAGGFESASALESEGADACAQLLLASAASKKIAEHSQSESTKNLKRAGVKLKLRRTVFSARIFDFFDPGVMERIQQNVFDMSNANKNLDIDAEKRIEFRAEIVSVRSSGKTPKQQEALVKWTPEDLIPDEWISLDQFEPVKRLKVDQLSEMAKAKFVSRLYPGTTENFYHRRQHENLSMDSSTPPVESSTKVSGARKRKGGR